MRCRLVVWVAFLVCLLSSSLAFAGTWLGSGPSGGAPRVASVSMHNGRAIVEVEVPGVWAETVQGAGKSWEHLTLPGGVPAGRVGEPELPESGLLVSLPEGRAVSVSVLSVDTETLGHFHPAPAQPKPCRCASHQPTRFVVDPSSYLVQGMLPTSPAVELSAPGWLRDVRVAQLKLRPIALDTATGNVLLHRRFTIEIEYASADPLAMAPRKMTALPRSFVPAVDGIHLDLRQGPRAIPGPDHLLVIGPASYLDNVQPLVDWRIKTGTRVTTTPMDQIGTTAASIKAYLQNAYDIWPHPPTIVLLVGDENAVPPDYGQVGQCAADYTYSKLAGTDLYPDVIMGRLSVRNEAEVDLQVGRIVAYETTPDTGSAASWYQGGVLIASSEGQGPSNDDVRTDQIYDLLQPWGYAPLPKYYASKNNNTPANINQSLDTGASWISYMGHGSETAWSSTEPEYAASTYVPALNNGNRLPVIWDVACLNGSFDLAGECFAETWTNTPGKGAIAIWASTVLASWDEPAIWSVEIARAFTHDGTFRFGETNVAGMLALMAIAGTGDNVEAEFEKFILFGDPLLEIRSKVPVALTADHAPSGNVQGGPFDVIVKANGAALEKARVAASSGGEVLAVGLTDPAGHVTLVLPQMNATSFTLTVTARDAVPLLEDVPLQPPGCGVVALSAQGIVACSQQLTITLSDQDLDVDSNAIETAAVTVTVAGVDHPVTLTETGAATHVFAGSVTFSKTPQGSEIGLAHGDVVTVTYQDAACSGQPVTVQRQLTAQCVPPQITAVTTDQITSTSARVNWTTDVAADSTVAYGEVSPPAQSAAANGFVKTHHVTLTGLKNGTKYLFSASSKDPVGNTATDDKGGAYYDFTTLVCSPACSGKQCGTDGCGGVCGTCKNGEYCNGDGVCECPTYDNPGCKGCACEACVCKIDEFCCKNAWDSQCVEECKNQCGGCAAGEPDAGTDSGVDASKDAAPDVKEAGLDAEAGKPDGSAGKAGSAGSPGKDSGPAEASAGKAGMAGSDGGSAEAPPEGDDGCGCRTAGSKRAAHAWWIAALALAVSLRRRRR